MDSDKNKLNKLFSESDPGLPPELSWEQMEEGIMEKMEELEPINGQPGPNNDTAFKIIITLLLCLLPVLFFNKGLLLETAGDQAALPQDQSPEDAEAPTTQSLSVNPASSRPVPQKSQPAGTATSQQDATEQPAADIGQQARAKQAATPSQPAATEARKEAHLPEPPTPAQKPQPIASSPTVIDQPVNRLTDEPLPPRSKRTLANDRDPQGQGPLATLPSLPIAALIAEELDVKPLPTTAPEKEQNKTLLPKNQFSLLSGISNWDPGYGSNRPEPARYEQSTRSFYTQLSYTYRFGNNYTVSAGLQYQQLQTQLAWSQRIEDYATVILQDTIVEIQVNALTGNSTAVRGDAEVSVDATRTVRHHNQYRLFQVPLAIGKSWKIGDKWQAGLSVGGALNLLTQNKGRSVYQGELEYMDGATTNLIDNRWGIHGLGRVNIGYRINARWGVMAEAQFHKSLTDWSRVSGVGMQPEVGSFGLGVYYAL